MAERAQGVDPNGDVVSARQRAYLVTLHPARSEGKPFVTVQASHSNQSRRFDDLASAFHYLKGLERPGREVKQPEP